MISQNSKRKTQNYNSNLKSNDVKLRAYRFSLEIISFVNNLPDKRAFWSIGANMIEAQAASSRKDFIKFYEIDLKSANETKYWICLLRDSYPNLKTECAELLLEANEISNMLGSSVLTLKGRKKF